MTNYTAHDINEWVSKYFDQFQYLVIAHTNCYPKDKSLQTIFSQQVKRQDLLEKTLIEVSKTLYPNEPFLPRDYRDEYGMLQFSTVEFNNPNVRSCDTMHFNVMLGNLPKEYTKEKLKEVFLETWNKKFKQSKDVWVHSVEDLVNMNESTNLPISAFNRYILKDAYDDKSKAWKVEGTWDVLNTWLPSSKLLTRR
jgi:hypothetical protein